MSASKLLKLTTDFADDGNSEQSWPASCCECCAAAAAVVSTKHQQLRNFVNPSALHPAFLGSWASHHSSMTITATKVHLLGDSPLPH